MATRQYIGARYVPKFAGEWNINSAYEPLTIVQDSNGNSYTSKVKVPAGIQLSNTAYWYQSAVFNAQVEALRQEIVSAQGDISDLNNDLSALDTETTTKLNAFRGAVRTGKNIVFIGDSWTVGSGATSAGNRFTTLLANRLGMVEKNFGVGGAGFTRPNTFLAQVNNANSQMTAAEKADTNIVLILGGVNDLRLMSETTLDAYAAAVRTCVWRACEVFPNATVVLAQATQTMDTTATHTQMNWIDTADRIIMQSISSNKCVRILHHIGTLLRGMAAYYQSDKLHPNNTGHQILAGYLGSVLCGGSEHVSRFIGMGATWNEAVSQESIAFHIFQDGDLIIFCNGQIRFTEPLTANTRIGQYNFVPPPVNNMGIPCYVSNENCGTLWIVGGNGNMFFTPNPDFITRHPSGVTAASWADHVYMYSTLSGS